MMHDFDLPAPLPLRELVARYERTLALMAVRVAGLEQEVQDARRHGRPWERLAHLQGAYALVLADLAVRKEQAERGLAELERRGG